MSKSFLKLLLKVNLIYISTRATLKTRNFELFLTSMLRELIDRIHDYRSGKMFQAKVC